MCRHSHCKADCPLHGSFASSLRKYSTTDSTKSLSRVRNTSKSKKLIQKQSSEYVKPFLVTDDRSSVKKGTQAQSLIYSVSLTTVKREENGNSHSLVKNSQIQQLKSNVDRLSTLVDKFKSFERIWPAESQPKIKQVIAQSPIAKPVAKIQKQLDGENKFPDPIPTEDGKHFHSSYKTTSREQQPPKQQPKNTLNYKLFRAQPLSEVSTSNRY